MTQSIIVELRPRLQVCNIFMVIKKKLCLNKLVKITIQTSSIDIIWISETNKIFQKIQLPECKLVPHTLSALKVENNSMSFRLQTEPTSNISGSFSTEILTFTNGDENRSLSFVPSFTAEQPCLITCRCCGNNVSKGNITFERTLPLPSVSWEMEDWFCHRHSEPSDAEGLSGTLRTRTRDCLFGSCHMVCHASMLDVIGENVMRCRRCLAWLGTKLVAGVKLWHCSVQYGVSDCETSAFQDFMSMLRDVLTGSMGALRRLVVETRLSEQETHYLLLWVMDTNLQILFHTDEGEHDKTTSEDIVEKVCDLELKTTMKLLYMYHQSCTAMVKLWQHDLQVQSLDVAKQMFTEGLCQLVRATQYIPTPHQETNNFFVAYLELI